MPKYLITWNAGYGESAEVEEHDDDSSANDSAYERWHEETERNADYSARILNKELADDYGIEFEGDEDEDVA